MSKDYLSREQAARRLSGAFTGVAADFVSASEAIGMGANAVRLSVYPAAGFPVDDDVLSEDPVLELIASVPGYDDESSVFAGYIKIYFNN